MSGAGVALGAEHRSLGAEWMAAGLGGSVEAETAQAFADRWADLARRAWVAAEADALLGSLAVEAGRWAEALGKRARYAREGGAA